jgi:hypothetical protein
MNRLGASSRSLSRRIVSPVHPRASKGDVDSAPRSPMDASLKVTVATAPLRHVSLRVRSSSFQHCGEGRNIPL